MFNVSREGVVKVAYGQKMDSLCMSGDWYTQLFNFLTIGLLLWTTVSNHIRFDARVAD